MKNDHSIFKEKRLVMLAGEKAPVSAEKPKNESPMDSVMPPEGSQLSAGHNDPDVVSEAKGIKAPKDTNEAAPIYDKYIGSVQKQINAFTKIEEKFNRDGNKDAVTKRKLIAAVEAAGGTVSKDEYFPRPSNTLYDSPARGEYGYKDLTNQLADQGSQNDLENLVNVGSDGYYWSKFCKQMVAINKRMQAAKKAFDETK